MGKDIQKPNKRGPISQPMKISSLFDIGKDTGKLTGKEKILYEDKCGSQRHLLSQEVDVEYDVEQQMLQEEQRVQEREFEEEMGFINADTEVVSPSSTRNMRRQSDKPITVDKEFQVEVTATPAPAIRKTRNTTHEIKDATATVSTKAGISVEKARVATQQVCEKVYGHRYKLEATNPSEPSQPKKPRSSDDYQIYENVLHPAITVNNSKHKKALYQEIFAAKALATKKTTTKVTLHVDTTQRSRIDGDWPSLILNFKDDNPLECRMISLCPLFFAYGDRSQIISLIVETLNRLSVAASKLNLTAANLWEKIDAVMTDAVTKNLKIEEGVSEKLQSSHVPLHLLCKSRTCERLDSDNITTPAAIQDLPP